MDFVFALIKNIGKIAIVEAHILRVICTINNISLDKFRIALLIFLKLPSIFESLNTKPMKNILGLKMLHFFYLLIIIIIAILLRFHNLDSKPLWIDEIITALISLGNSYEHLPLNTLIHPQDIINIFQFNHDSSCPVVMETLTYQSTHPPLFFCLVNVWLRKWQNSAMNLWWQLRILPAIFGVIIVYLIYVLNRYLSSRKNALLATGLMAVSPFGIYLSQEARHYTLAMLLILLGLILLVRNIDNLAKDKTEFKLWLVWSIVMGVSFYSHYYCLLAYVAQLCSLIFYLFVHSKYGKFTLQSIHNYLPLEKIDINQQTIKLNQKKIIVIIISVILPLIIFSPWLSIFIAHAGSDKTSWLPSPNLISPFYQTIMAWILMIVALPVESPLLIVQIFSGLVMFIFVVYVSKIIVNNWLYTWKKYPQILILFIYVVFSAGILIVLSYLFAKDLTIVPRYSFFYYPAFISLIAIFIYPNSVNNSDEYQVQKNRPEQIWLILIMGFISSLCVLQNLVFQKPYEPEKIAQQFNQSSEPTMLVFNYKDTNEIAFSLSYAYAFSNLPSVNPNTDIAIFDYSQDYDRVWSQLSQLDAQPSLLWIVAPGLVFKNYPQQISFTNQVECKIDPKEYYRLGFPRQLYRCQRKENRRW